MTVFCPNCGKPNTDEATKCAACGNDLRKGGAKKFRGTMMMSTPPVSKPPGAPSSPGSIPAQPSAPPAAPAPATAPSVAPVNKNIAFQKTMLGTPPAGTDPSSSAPPPAAGSSAPPPARPRQGTLLGTAPMSPNPQGFGAPPAAGGEVRPPFGAPPTAAPVPVQPMGQPTAPAGSFGQAPAGPTGGAAFGQTPSGSAFGQEAPPASTGGGFGQPPAAGGFGVPGGQFGGADDPAKKKKLMLFGGIGCLVLILLCCITGYVAYAKLKQAAVAAQTEGGDADGDSSMAGVTAELARIPLTFVLTQILSQCKSDPSGTAIKPFFHPQVFDRLHTEACSVDENVITVFRDTEATKVTNLLAVPEASMAKDLGLNPGACYLFDAGKGARIITCRDESNATKIIHLEGIAQLRAQ